MDANGFYHQEIIVKTINKSCIKDATEISYIYGEVEDDNIFSEDQMVVFAEAYHQAQLESMTKTHK